MLLSGQPFVGVGEIPPGADPTKPGVHTSALEVVAYDSHTSHGDIYVVAYNDTNGGTSFTTWDTRQQAHQQTYRATATMKGVNAVGHTRKCVNSGVMYTNGCAWIAGSRISGKLPYLDIYQVRNLGGTSGVAYTRMSFQMNIASPAGDAGFVCLDSRCTAFTERILVVYTDSAHRVLKGRLLDISGATIGSEITLWTTASSGMIWRPEVAWYQDGIYGGNWVVTFEVKEQCPGFGLWGRIRGMHVTWSGVPGYGQDTALGWCGTMEFCGGTAAGESAVAAREASESDPAPLVISGDCYAMWISAEAPSNTLHPWVLLTEYNKNYPLGTAGGLLMRASATGAFRPVAGTDLTGAAGPYSFRILGLSPKNYGRMSNELPPWAALENEGPATNHATLIAQGLRRADSTMGALFTSALTSNDLFLTVLDN